MEVIEKSHYKTEIGLIPSDWKVYQVSQLLELLTDYDANGSFSSVAENVQVYDHEEYAWYVRSTDLENDTSESQVRYVDKESYQFLKKTKLYGGELLFLKRGDIGKVYFFRMKTKKATLAPNLYLLKLNSVSFPMYLFYFFNSQRGQSQLKSKNASSTLGALYKDDVKSVYVPLPPTLTEQKAIATALSDVDALIAKLDQLIEKKKAIKQGVMQELLTGKTRLEGFGEGKGYKKTELGEIPEDWEVKELIQVSICLDNLRVPLNESERGEMNGDIPYCGANGVVDYINDYVIDDDIILMAEDGGYFDEYKTRPIAYRMTGKCWVNNHAHILKSVSSVSQDFLFYSLVHKNILNYINGGTRAKLNRNELNKIQIPFPDSKREQDSIGELINSFESELASFKTKREKLIEIKQGVMQELLTGKTRLI